VEEFMKSWKDYLSATPGPPRLIKMPEVKSRTGHSESKIYGGVSDGSIPPPVATGSNSVGWVEAEIDAYVRFLIAQRDDALAFAAANPAPVQRRVGRPTRSPWHQQPVRDSESPTATSDTDIQQT
jgi:prophage regulatory protein